MLSLSPPCKVVLLCAVRRSRLQITTKMCNSSAHTYVWVALREDFLVHQMMTQLGGHTRSRLVPLSALQRYACARCISATLFFCSTWEFVIAHRSARTEDVQRQGSEGNEESLERSPCTDDACLDWKFRFETGAISAPMPVLTGISMSTSIGQRFCHRPRRTLFFFSKLQFGGCCEDTASRCLYTFTVFKTCDPSAFRIRHMPPVSTQVPNPPLGQAWKHK